MIGVERPAIQPNVGTIAAQLDEALGAVVTGVCTEKLDSDVLVMKPPDQGMRHDATDPLNRSRDRRIFVQ
jgi:hypothetical protein